MKFISFFAGIGGFDLGLERAGHKCVGQVEIDAFCLEVLSKHWPEIPKWRDINDLTGKELPDADMWCGGFPCQDISEAGKRIGIRGARSGLFFQLARLVCEIRPKYLLLENVRALLTGGIGDVLGELARSGYDAEWQVLSAGQFGALHQRKRVFILAYDHKIRCNSDEIFSSLNKKVCSQRPPSELVMRNENDLWGWPDQPNTCGVVHGLSPRLDERIGSLGNAVVPCVAEYIGRLLRNAEL